jgi:hypothetical protein
MNKIRLPFTPRDNKVELYEHEAVIKKWHEVIGLRPVDYEITDEFALFEATFDDKLKEMLNQAGPDMYNDRYYDSVIDAQVNKAFAALGQQRVTHLRTVKRINNTRDAAIFELELELEHCKATIRELESFQSEYNG